ncbi:MAG: hypothetical protein IJT98_10060 [Prevotella sp.]|nr:hypothetical protein [Prevotella sp.]
MEKNRKAHRFLQTFGIVVIVLALVRCAFPDIARDNKGAVTEDAELAADTARGMADSVATSPVVASAIADMPRRRAHRVRGVSNYDTAFPDSNHVQLVAAQRWGVKPVKDRANAEQRKDELVYVGMSPYYHVAHLDASIPYLVPRAALLLEDIGRQFYDSLYVKDIPLCRMVVSSALRSERDVVRLRRSNHNATEHSCHLYGTTFDISYNWFNSMQGDTILDDRMKRVLAEVLDNLRKQGRCYIKYEKKQPCFHITVR